MNMTTQCLNCGSSTGLKWHPGKSRNQDGQLQNAGDTSEFFLGCDACGEILQSLSGDKVAGLLNKFMQPDPGAAPALSQLLSAIEHYRGQEKTEDNERALQSLLGSAGILQNQKDQQLRLRAALNEATDTLQRELLPALEDKEMLVEMIDGFRAIAAGGKAAQDPALLVLLDYAEQQKFERFVDMNTMLVFMAGCAIRERMGVVRDYRAKAAQGVRPAIALLPDEELVVRDYCRLIALCEQTSPGDVQRSFEAIVESVFSG